VRQIIFILIIPILSFSQQLHLTESSNWLNIGDLSIEGNQVTLEAQIFIEAEPIVPYKFNILSKHEDISNVNYFFRPTNFGITTYNSGNSGPTTFYNLFVDLELDLFQFYHVAATYNGEVMMFYINGCLVKTLDASGNLFQNSFPTGLGQRWIIEDEQYVGYLDDVRIWSVARTQEEISSNMDTLLNLANQNGLVALYDFEGDFVNKVNPGIFDGTPVGNPILKENNFFIVPFLTFPQIQIEEDCETMTSSI